MAYQMMATAGVFIRNSLNICTAFYTISTDTVLARFFCISRACPFWFLSLYDRPIPTQPTLRALNVPVSSADAEAERALNSYRPITNWCVLADSLFEESLKTSVQWHGMETCMSI